MKIYNLLHFSWLLILLASCRTADEPAIVATVQSARHLDRLSSASGIVYAKSTYYVIGDDSPWLYRVSESLESAEWVRLSGTDSLVNGRMPKLLKADFESMEELIIDDHDYLIFLSSGSMELTRDTADIVDITDGSIVSKKNIRPLFEKIKQVAGMSGKDEINIEGLAITDSAIYMLHRGNISGNLIISVNTRPFYEYLIDSAQIIPDFDLHHFDLPVYDNATAGFSGACVTPDGQYLVFTASIEKTDDVYSDGEIAGSYIGVIPFEKMSEGVFLATLLEHDGKVLPKKLEGVAVHDMAGNIAHVLVVTDNDDGTSDLFEVELVFPDKK